MSLYGMMRTSVSGMAAQANLLGTVADNIANASTAGYKKAGTEFSTLLVSNEPSVNGEYQSGSVQTRTTYAISEQGGLDQTGSDTDLAVRGNGFFLVKDTGGAVVMTRAGGFTVDASTGNLVNAAGYTLLGYSTAAGTSNAVVNGTAGLEPVHLGNVTLAPIPTTAGTFSVNLPAEADVGTAKSSSFQVYDTLGAQAIYDVTFTRTAAAEGSESGRWTMKVTSRATGLPAAETQTLVFGADGAITSPVGLDLKVPDMEAANATTVAFDISAMVQRGADFQAFPVTVNGAAASIATGVSIATDGTVYAVNDDGAKFALYRIPLGYVTSPDNLSPTSGNAYVVTPQSGALQIGFAGEGGLGTVTSGSVEKSNVDTATELTRMIVAQRDYTANSKVFQTGTELFDVLMSLKR